MSDPNQSPDRSHAQSEADKKAAAKAASPRLARRGYDPQMARNFALWDGE